MHQNHAQDVVHKLGCSLLSHIKIISNKDDMKFLSKRLYIMSRFVSLTTIAGSGVQDTRSEDRLGLKKYSPSFISCFIRENSGSNKV